MKGVSRLVFLMRPLAVLAFGIALVAPAGAADTKIVAAPAGWTQPGNVGTAETRALAYHESGAYLRDLGAVDDQAADWLAAEAPKTSKPALVLDIDETSLSNWEEIKANGFGYFPGGPCDSLPQGPCGFTAWERSDKAPALAPTLRLFTLARTLGVAVFFVTGRQESLAATTAENLRRVGYHDWAGLVLEPDGSRFASAADFKAARRAAIEASGYTVLATVGDQRSDLDGGHARRGFLLPNPFYFIP